MYAGIIIIYQKRTFYITMFDYCIQKRMHAPYTFKMLHDLKIDVSSRLFFDKNYGYFLTHNSFVIQHLLIY